MNERFETFEQFWPYYVREHAKKSTRMLHFVGTGTALLAGAVGLVSRRRRWLLAAVPVIGYGAAWIGHFFFEKNMPATFRYPVWSLRADFVMFTKIIAGTMDDEVDRVMREYAARQDNGTNGEDVHVSRESEISQDPSSLN